MKRRPVTVPISDLRRLRIGWAAFQRDDAAGYDPLGEAVQRLLDRLRKAEADRRDDA